jgi:hypothetical protein
MHITEIVRALPANLVRITSGKIKSEKLDPARTNLGMQARNLSIHVVLPEGFSPDELPEGWQMHAAVISVAKANGEVVAILKNRYGATSR